jgi:hypothetical protein
MRLELHKVTMTLKYQAVQPLPSRVDIIAMPAQVVMMYQPTTAIQSPKEITEVA